MISSYFVYARPITKNAVAMQQQNLKHIVDSTTRVAFMVSKLTVELGLWQVTVGLHVNDFK